MPTTPDDDFSESLRAQLREELDRVPLNSLQPSQARFQTLGDPASGSWVRFGAGAATAVVAFLLLGVSVGGLRPPLWMSRTAAAIQHVRSVAGGPAPSPTPSPSRRVRPATADMPQDEPSPGSEARTGAAQPTGGSSEPASEPPSEPSSEPTNLPSPASDTGGDSGPIATGTDPLPSPSPSSEP